MHAEGEANDGRRSRSERFDQLRRTEIHLVDDVVRELKIGAHELEKVGGKSRPAVGSGRVQGKHLIAGGHHHVEGFVVSAPKAEERRFP